MRSTLTLPLVLGLLQFAPRVHAQDPAAAAEPPPKVEIRPAEPVGEKPKLQIRSANFKNPKGNAVPSLGPNEQKIIATMKDMRVEQVRELAELYSRVGNPVMTGILVSELTRRDPKDPTIEALSAAPGDGTAPDDPEATKAQELIMSGKNDEGAKLLQKLKAEKYQGRSFPYLQDLAYALLESGQEDAAKAAFNELIRSTSARPEDKADASRSLASLALEALQRKGQAALTARDARRAVQVADQLLARNPQDPDAVELKASALSMMGRGREAIAWLQDLKITSSKSPFAHQKVLAEAYYDAQLLDSAEEAYQEIIDHPQSTSEDRAEARSRLKALRSDRLIARGEIALNKNKMAEAEAIARELEADIPVSPATKAFRASILNKQGRFLEAGAILERLRQEQNREFDANAELANAYMNTGRWQEAADQFAIVENNPKNDKLSRFDAARLRREMLARFRPTVSSRYEAESGAEGTVWRAAGEVSSGIIGDGNMLILRTEWDQVHLAGARTIARQDAERFQAELAYRRVVSSGFFGEASIGGSDNDLVYGGKVGRLEGGSGLAWELSYKGNDRARDSLALEALNGRQNALQLYLGTHFSRRFYLDARVFFRQVHVHNHDLGQGWGLDMNIGCTLVEETMRRPELQIAYFNELSYFNTRQLPADFVQRNTRRGFAGNLSDQLIDRGINRHGIQLTLSKQLNHRVSAYIYGGVSYEFEIGQAEGRAGAGIEAYLAPNATLNIGVDYTTSGNAGNQGSDVLSGTVGVKMSF